MLAALALAGRVVSGFFGGIMDWLHKTIPADVWRTLAVLLLGTVIGWQSNYIFYNVPALREAKRELAAKERAEDQAREQREQDKRRAAVADRENQERRTNRESNSRKIMESVDNAPETHSLANNPMLRAYLDGLRRTIIEDGHAGTPKHGVSSRTGASR